MIEVYLKELKGRDEKTVRKKEERLNHLQEFFEEEVEIYEWDGWVVRKFYDFLKAKNLSSSTIQRIFLEVRAFLRWLKKRGYSAHFDEEEYRELWKGHRVREEMKRKIKYLTEDELGRVLRAIRGLEEVAPKHPIYYVFTILLAYSGLRVEEALRVSPEDLIIKEVITESGERKEVLGIRVRAGKFGKERIAYMPLLSAGHKETLKRFFRERQGRRLWEYELVFIRVDKERTVKRKVLTYHAVYQTYRRLGKALGIRLHPHIFRYTYAVMLLRKGVPVNLVQSWLGHESAKITLEMYAKVKEEEGLIEVVEKL